VREEIERVEGRLRVLSEQTSLATITLTVTEVKDYVPEEPPGYMKRVREAFRASVEALVTVAQELSIALVALAPWIGALLVLAIPVILIWRIARRRWRAKLVQAEVVPQSPFEG
jgi:hypothetical protein